MGFLIWRNIKEVIRLSEKVYLLRKKLMKKQIVTEDMFAELTPKEMMDLAQLLVSDYNLLCMTSSLKENINNN